MHSSEIVQIIEKYPCIAKNFYGIYSIDLIPKHFPVKYFIIFNEDLSTNEGTHWLALFRKSNQTLECFDSLGFNETKQSRFLKYCKIKKVKNIKFNETPFQPITSNKCGLYAIYFCLNRLLNLDLSLKTMLSEYFDDNILKNDTLIDSFFNEHG